jgi:hypothetical protein
VRERQNKVALRRPASDLRSVTSATDLDDAGRRAKHWPTDEQPDPDRTKFVLPGEDDGSRDHPLLSGRAVAITTYHPDIAAPAAALTRGVIAVGEADASGLLPSKAARP